MTRHVFYRHARPLRPPAPTRRELHHYHRAQLIRRRKAELAVWAEARAMLTDLLRPVLDAVRQFADEVRPIAAALEEK